MMENESGQELQITQGFVEQRSNFGFIFLSALENHWKFLSHRVREE